MNDGKVMPNGRPNDHIAIGDGSFPMDLIGLIKKSGFKGPTIFELGFADAQKSLQRIKQQYPDI